MKRDDILNMPAGREMDALVKSFVMGGLPPVGNDIIDNYISHYSTDISAAWEVVEKLGSDWDFAIVNNQHYRQYPDLHYGFRMQALDEEKHIKTVFALAETAPLAICRAALLSVMGDE